jgi:anti-sigma B factor antagonist
MKITEENIENILTIAVSGRLDMITSKDLETVLDRAIEKNQWIIVDLKDTDYISSSGLRVLLAGLERLKAKNGDLRLTSLQPVVREVFEISGLSNLFSLHANLSEAVDSISPKEGYAKLRSAPSFGNV